MNNIQTPVCIENRITAFVSNYSMVLYIPDNPEAGVIIPALWTAAVPV
jgi:hypothetical protein